MRDERPSSASAAGLRIGVAVSRYHEAITSSLLAAAERCFLDRGGAPGDLLVAPVPGSFELVAAGRALAYRGDLDGIVALGCVIAGETEHDRVINAAVSHGLVSITIETGLPIAFGLLTCRNREQALERSGGARGNKGEEAMLAVIETVAAVRAVSKGAP